MTKVLILSYSFTSTSHFLQTHPSMGRSGENKERWRKRKSEIKMEISSKPHEHSNESTHKFKQHILKRKSLINF